MDRQKLRILIVEDETIIRTSFAMAIEDMGHIVAGEAANGEQALEMVHALHPDMVLLDINLPKMNGLKVLETIGGEHGVPCIIITGYYSEEFLERAKQAGAYNYLIKPIDTCQLEATITVTHQRFLEYQRCNLEAQRLQTALEERKLVERAKGVLIRRHGLSEEQAMRSLQKKSRDLNKKLADVARDIIYADRLIGEA